jgi:release factor glutamine methyltransferase
MIYQPAEDSYLLSNIIKSKLKGKNKSIAILDMGSGSGIQTQTCNDLGFQNVISADINPEVINHLKKKNFKTIQTNLFSKISKDQKFDLIIFNPPYLPEDKREPKDSMLNTTAGKKGYEIITNFLKQARDYLSESGKIFLLFSSLSQPKTILDESKGLGYKSKLLSKEKLDFEELYVYEFSKLI